VNGILLQLSRAYMVKCVDGTTGFLGMPNEVESIIKALDLNILPKS
jgi:hypothetical protein